MEVDFLKNMSILVVEDSDIDREILVKVLSKYFGTIFQAENGDVAYSIFSKNKNIDLIIADMNMPEMTGLELLKLVRLADISIPFIFITARSDSETILDAINLNASSYILKPLNFTELLQKIDFICEKKYYEKQLKQKKNEIENYIDAVDKVACIFKMNSNGNITYMNKTLLEIAGYEASEIAGLNFDDIIHPDVPKKYIDETWEEIKNDKLWKGNTKFLSKSKETFYLNNAIFKINNENEEFITIAFLTTKENLEKRDFHKKVLLNIKASNKKEFELKEKIKELATLLNDKKFTTLNEKKLIEELKEKIVANQRQLNHYELQMENVNQKYTKLIESKKDEINSYIETVKEKKKKVDSLIHEKNELNEDIELLRKQNKRLVADNEKKAKKINDLMNIVLEYEE